MTDRKPRMILTQLSRFGRSHQQRGGIGVFGVGVVMIACVLGIFAVQLKFSTLAAAVVNNIPFSIEGQISGIMLSSSRNDSSKNDTGIQASPALMDQSNTIDGGGDGGGDRMTRTTPAVATTRTTTANDRPVLLNQRKNEIAYAISITDCPSHANPQRHGIVDGPAILAHSIHRNSLQNPQSGSRYDYRLYAFVHPDARKCTRHLSSLNYTVLIMETPVNAALIKKAVYRERVQNPGAGCCREKEFLKLYSLTLADYPVVVHLDTDALLLKPMDFLFDAMLLQPDSHPKYLGCHVQWPHQRNVSTRIETFFVRDYPMGNRGWSVEHFGMQGGFWIVRPNQTSFQEMRHLILEGNFSAGWYDGRVHYPGFYGAAMIQGLLGFYYGHVSPGQMVELNHCLYNNMADDPLGGSKQQCQLPSTPLHACEDCRKTNLSDIFSFHFTFCTKPWLCNTYASQDPKGPLCEQAMRAWFETRHHLETVVWNNTNPQPVGTAAAAATPHRFGFCSPKYRPMNFHRAKSS